MNYRQSVTLALLILLAFTVVCWIAVSEHRPVQAQSVQEVPPYKFADLPHGRIYKAVHEGCELYIVESNLSLQVPEQYAITTGRCQ